MNVTTTEQFIHQQLAGPGWVPLHADLVKYLCPSAYDLGRDVPSYLRNPGQLPKIFKGASLYEASIDGLGRVLVLSRSSQLLAERMGWVGLAVSGVSEYAGERHEPVTKATATTSDPLALLHADVATAEAPIPCKGCGNLSSAQTCLVAQHIEGAPKDKEYRPDLSWPRRCLSYAPPRIIEGYAAPSDYDRRTGRARWPEVAAVVDLQVQGDSAIGKAVALLSGLLKDGPRDAAEILAAAEGASIGERSMQRAAEQLGVVKSKARFDGGWTWAMPLLETKSAA